MHFEAFYLHIASVSRLYSAQVSSQHQLIVCNNNVHYSTDRLEDRKFAMAHSFLIWSCASRGFKLICNVQNWLGETDKLDDTHNSRKSMSLESMSPVVIQFSHWRRCLWREQLQDIVQKNFSSNSSHFGQILVRNLLMVWRWSLRSRRPVIILRMTL